MDIHSSTNFTVPKGVKKIDVFCVGGGGSGRGSGSSYSGGGRTIYTGGGGGGGGYTNTVKSVSVTPGQQLSVVVGDGGSGGHDVYGNDGGTSSVGKICSANGGCVNREDLNHEYRGASGGSGGGAGAYYMYTEGMGNDYGWKGNVGGKDGGNGEDAILDDAANNLTIKPTGGKGQSTTTRYFGESSGTLYSTGGCGMFSPSNYGTSFLEYAVANTGNGGDGGRLYNPYYGSSGICIIRWGKQ